MNWMDVLLILIAGGAFIGCIVWLIRSRKKRKGCPGCCSCCSHSCPSAKHDT